MSRDRDVATPWSATEGGVASAPLRTGRFGAGIPWTSGGPSSGVSRVENFGLVTLVNKHYGVDMHDVE